MSYQNGSARSVPIRVVAQVYGKDPAWVRKGIIEGWLPIGVTTTRSYEYLALKMDVPLCRSSYYERYRKYFYLLAQKR